MEKFFVRVVGNLVALVAYIWIMGTLIVHQSLPFLGEITLKADLDPSRLMIIGSIPIMLLPIAWLSGNIVGGLLYLLWQMFAFAWGPRKQKNQLRPIS